MLTLPDRRLAGSTGVSWCHEPPLLGSGRPEDAATAALRFSRAAGLPEPLPDALGVAGKLPDVYGPGADQDLLLTSSIDRPLLRRLLFLAKLDAATTAGLQFQLRTAGSLGPSQPAGNPDHRIALTAEQTEQLRFNPWTTGPGIRPSGWINLLRDTAYRAGQRARPHAGRPSPTR